MGEANRVVLVLASITILLAVTTAKTQQQEKKPEGTANKLRFEFVNMTAEGGAVKLGPTSHLSQPEEDTMQLTVALELEDTLEHGARFHNLTLPLPPMLERNQLHTVATLGKDASFPQLKLSKGEHSLGHVNASVALTGVPNDVDDMSMEIAYYKDVSLPLRLFFKVSSKDVKQEDTLKAILKERGFHGQEHGLEENQAGEDSAVLLISLRAVLVLQKLPAAQQEVEINGQLHHFRASHLPDSVYEAAASSYVIAMEHEGAAKKGPAKDHPGTDEEADSGADGQTDSSEKADSEKESSAEEKGSTAKSHAAEKNAEKSAGDEQKEAHVSGDKKQGHKGAEAPAEANGDEMQKEGDSNDNTDGADSSAGNKKDHVQEDSKTDSKDTSEQTDSSDETAKGENTDAEATEGAPEGAPHTHEGHGGAPVTHAHAGGHTAHTHEQADEQANEQADQQSGDQQQAEGSQQEGASTEGEKAEGEKAGSEAAASGEQAPSEESAEAAATEEQPPATEEGTTEAKVESATPPESTSSSTGLTNYAVYVVAGLAVVAAVSFGIVRWRRRRQLAGYQSVAPDAAEDEP